MEAIRGDCGVSILHGMLTNGIKRAHMPSVVAFFWRLALAMFITWSVGTYAPVGIHGFAYATTVAKQSEQLDEILRLQIAQELRRRKVDYCAAPPQSDRRQAIAYDMSRLQEQYKKLSKGEEYLLPTCAEL